VDAQVGRDGAVAKLRLTAVGPVCVLTSRERERPLGVGLGHVRRARGGGDDVLVLLAGRWLGEHRLGTGDQCRQQYESE
jgi:hypothetical protein